jgi:hypothetical protein
MKSSERRQLILAIVSVISGLAALVVLLGEEQIPTIIRRAVLGSLPLWAGLWVLHLMLRRQRQARRESGGRSAGSSKLRNGS